MASVSIIFSEHTAKAARNVILAIQDPKRRRLPTGLEALLGMEYFEIYANQSIVNEYIGVRETIKKLGNQQFDN